MDNEPPPLDADAWPVVLANHIVPSTYQTSRAGLSLREEGAPGEIDMGAGGIFITSMASGAYSLYWHRTGSTRVSFPAYEFRAPIGPQGAQTGRRREAYEELCTNY